MTDLHYGPFRKALAFRIGDRLFVGVDGPRPGPGYEASLRRFESDPGSDPPVRLELFVRKRREPVPGPEAAFPARIEVHVGDAAVERVRVRHASGFEDVAVQRLPLSTAHFDDPGARRYTGWSSTSFDEAYRNALALIPPDAEGQPLHTRVVAQGGVHGGLAGLDQVFVTVLRIPAPLDGEAGGKVPHQRLKVVRD
jgi:hypothetical protein